MTPVELSRTVLRAVRRAVDDGELSVAVPAHVVVTPPGPGGSGDYATNIALQLARPAGRPPLQVAAILLPHLSGTEGVAAVEITGPGFLNIHLDRAATTTLVRRILGTEGTEGTERTVFLPYGHSDTLAGQVLRLRIPYDIRAEVVADALVRIVASQGGRVEVDHIRPQHIAADQGDDGSPDRPDGPIDLRPVPAPEDPTPLGPDALRWALLHPAAHDRPRITADLLAQRAGNPLFRVRYAHARVRALTRNAAALGFTAAPGPLGAPCAPAEPYPSATQHTADPFTPVVTALTTYPSTLTRAATLRAPDRLARHLVVLADALLAFQHTVLPRGDEKPSAAHRARLALAEATGTVLAGGLSLLGIDAPDYL
ncbi:ArgS-related anticodon-binding protein NrtL [Streptomyces scabiei]|uniref:ArgS-related anticodon-binding protein NrtL n=1 Tax=Streptomyces scabiei TaxID=1930 RepID=UPI0029B7CE29|nr:DALR anticodon-binding domain-containing protein [Streptomyces scabiei]MDX3522946.1 DALR anticodon-binding domain-containing protein [Streptomyces scabiei]